MNVNELYNLAKWYESNILKTEFISLLQITNTQINSLLKGNVDAASIDAKLKELSEKINKHLSRFDIGSLNFDDITVLKKIGLEYIILTPAKESITHLFLKDKDLQNVSARMHDMQKKISTANQKFTQILHTIPSFFNDEELKHFTSKKILTRVHFHNKASIENLVKLNEWSDSWYKIARGYSMTLGIAAEDFEIVGASKGSIILDLLLNLETVNMLGETFNHIADFVLTCGEIKALLKTSEYLKDRDSETYQNLINKLEVDLEKNNNDMAEKIADLLYEKHAVNKNNHEAKTNLKSSIKELNKFIDRGGDISFKSADNNIETEEQIKLVNEAILMLQERSEQLKIEDKT